MNRILRRPMFRTGGSAEGITSGLAPRQGYDNGNIVEELKQKKSIIEALAPRQPRKDTSKQDFWVQFGLDLASRPPQGNILSTAAASGKDPFAKFQQAKQIEDAYKAKETTEDRALIADLIKGMNDDQLSALMKDVEAGMKSGLFKTEAEGINWLLKKKIFGVQKEEGEIKQDIIQTRAGTLLEQDEDLGYDSAISIAEAAQRIFDNKVEGVTKEDIDTDQLFIESETLLYMGEPDADTGVYTLPTDASPGDQTDLEDTYQDGMVYYNYRNGRFYRKNGKQFIPVDQPE